MNEVFCIDETFDIHSTLSYNLLISAGIEGLSYSVLNTVNNKFILLKFIPFPDIAEDALFDRMEKCMDDDEYLALTYKSVFISYITRKYSFFPEEFVIPDKLKTFFEQCFALDDLDEIHTQKIEQGNFHCVYTIPNRFSNAMLKRFQNSKFYFHSTSIINEGIELSKLHTHGVYFHLNICRDWFEIFIFANGALLLNNTFSYHSPQDILYYLIYTSKQLSIKNEDVIMICSGLTDKNSNLYRLLVKYFNSVRFAVFKKDFVYSYTFNKINPHQFTNLINLYSCV